MNKFFIFGFFILIFSASCNKDAALEGDGNNNELLNFGEIDSFKVKTNTVDESTLTGKNISTVLLGAVNDSRFGIYKAAFYTQLSLSSNSFELGNDAVYDSIVLVFDQPSSFGPSTSTFDLVLYEFDHDIDPADSYDNNTVLNLKGSPLGNFSNYKFNKDESEIRLKLEDAFGTKLYNQFGTEVMESSDNFKAFFNGLYCTASSANGDAIVSLNLKSDETKLILYYHNSDNEKKSFDYKVETTDVSISQYNRDVDGSEAQQAIAANNKDEGESFISSMSGVKTQIEFPDMKNLEGVIVNKAELTVYQADYGSTETVQFPEPDRLFLFQNINDSIQFLPDFDIGNSTAFGGFKELVEVDGVNTNEYTFNITQYIQSLINGTQSTNNLFLSNLSNNQANRIKIAGGSHPSLPVKLNILYTIKK